MLLQESTNNTTKMLRPEHPLSITPEAPHEQPPYDVTGAWVLDSGGLILPPGADTAIVNPFDRAESHPGIVTPDTLDQLPPNLTAWTSPVGELCVPPINGDGERPTTIQIVEELPPELVPDTDKDKSQAVDTYIWLSRPQAALRIFATETGNGQAQRLLGFLGDWEHRPHEIEPISDDTEKQEIAHEVDKFIAGVVRETALLLTKRETATDTLRVVTDLVDTVRFETKSAYLDCPETAATVAEVALERPEVLNSAVVNLLLKKIEIPPSVAGDLLGLMDRTGQLKQPLAWRLLDKLPDDHPFKDEQRTRVEDLKTVLTGNISPEQLSKAKELAQTIISVYVDPEEAGGVMVGLELEALSRIDAVGVPEGTGVGFDASGESTPEVRLIKADHVLRYGKDWRKRYHDLHTWTGLTQALRQSLHIHIDRSENTNPELYRRLFGYNWRDVDESVLGTMEIRTALANYTDVQKSNPANMTERGFSSEYMPELVELALSLRDVAFVHASERVHGGKPEEVLELIDDPTARAAMMVALSCESGLRLSFINPEKQISIVEHVIENGFIDEDFFWNDEGFAGVPNTITDPELQSLIADFAIEEGLLSELMKHRLVGITDPVLQSRIVDAAIEGALIRDLIYPTLSIITDPVLQSRIVDAAIDNEVLGNLAFNIRFIRAPEQQSKVIELVLEEGKERQLMGSLGDVYDPKQQAQLVELCIERGWVMYLLESDSLDYIRNLELRERLIDIGIERGLIYELINHLGAVTNLDQRARIVQIAIERGDELSILGRLDAVANPEQKAHLVDTAIQQRLTASTVEIIEAFDGVERQDDIIELIALTIDGDYLGLLLDKFSHVYLDPQYRQRLIDRLLIDEQRLIDRFLMGKEEWQNTFQRVIQNNSTDWNY
jgi:hypothetical protein